MQKISVVCDARNPIEHRSLIHPLVCHRLLQRQQVRRKVGILRLESECFGVVNDKNRLGRFAAG